jgi:hypothetical protein
MLRFHRFVLLLFISILVVPGARADALSFSWLDIAATSLHQDQAASGHGGRLALSYALSDQASMYVDGAQQDFDTQRDRRYDFGVGINTDPAAGYVLYATVGWDHAEVDYPAAPGQLGHGFDAGVGIRALLAERWEAYAEARYAHNDVLAESASGNAGIRYALSTHLSLGAGLTVDASQTAYLLSLRIYY